MLTYVAGVFLGSGAWLAVFRCDLSVMIVRAGLVGFCYGALLDVGRQSVTRRGLLGLDVRMSNLAFTGP